MTLYAAILHVPAAAAVDVQRRPPGAPTVKCGAFSRPTDEGGD